MLLRRLLENPRGVLWYVRQVNRDGPFMKTDYLCGGAHSRLGQALQAQWTLLV